MATVNTVNTVGTVLAVGADANIRMGLPPNVGAGDEAEPVDGFAEEVEDLIDLPGAQFATVNQAQDAADRFTAITADDAAALATPRSTATSHRPGFRLYWLKRDVLRGRPTQPG